MDTHIETTWRSQGHGYLMVQDLLRLEKDDIRRLKDHRARSIKVQLCLSSGLHKWSVKGGMGREPKGSIYPRDAKLDKRWLRSGLYKRSVKDDIGRELRA